MTPRLRTKSPGTVLPSGLTRPPSRPARIVFPFAYTMDIDDAYDELEGGADATVFDSLPSEVTEHVFRQLSLTDRMAFARVSPSMS